MTPPNPRYIARITTAVTRLYFLILGVDEDVLYHSTSTPEEDQQTLLDLMEESRNAWRQLRRRRSNRPLES